jgi:hypothetical protein
MALRLGLSLQVVGRDASVRHRGMVPGMDDGAAGVGPPPYPGNRVG